MRRALGIRRVALAAALLVSVVAFRPAAAAPSRFRVVAKKVIDARLVQVRFSTTALAANTDVRILLPAGFDPSGRTRYPVLYLLHGAFGNDTDWTVQGDAEAITAPYQVIVVMPDGGPDGNYVNWYNYGQFGVPEWETYHIGQLVPWVDATFPTIASRAGRAIAGLSMGGAGSSHYAARHPDLFSAMAAFSGATDTNETFEVPVTELGGPDANAAEAGPKPPGAVYGLRNLDEIRWRADNATDLAQNLRGMTLYLATGNGTCNGSFDPTEYDVHQQEIDLHTALLQLGIPHTWDDYGPGCHSWPFWQRDLRHWMPMVMAAFAAPTPAPSPFAFKAAESTYEVFGWSVQMTRPAMEWSYLRNASSHGFTWAGSGSAVVHVPGFVPGSTHTVNGAPSVAGPDGRLSVTVRLGPGNPLQEYLPLASTRVFQRTVTIGS